MLAVAGARRSALAWSLAAAALAAGGAAFAQDVETAAAPAGNAELMKKLERMEQRIRALEGQLKKKEPAEASPAGNAKPATGAAAQSADPAPAEGPAAAEKPADPETPAKTAPAKAAKTAKAAMPDAAKADAAKPDAEKPDTKPILGVLDSPVTGLAIGAYGEIQFGDLQNPAAGGQWQLGSDPARRFVLLPTYAITDNVIFNAEIEFEHAGVGFDNDDKLHGTAEIEQLWIDFKIVDQLNWRAPGIDLVPIGWINQPFDRARPSPRFGRAVRHHGVGCAATPADAARSRDGGARDRAHGGRPRAV